LTKEKMHALVEHMPESFTEDQMIDEIILMKKLEIAREQCKNGEFLTSEEMKKEIDSWDLK
jgi:hypothetical protein